MSLTTSKKRLLSRTKITFSLKKCSYIQKPVIHPEISTFRYTFIQTKSERDMQRFWQTILTFVQDIH